ncbi:hypothetical protein [Leucobacter sp. gxy201]|uniref:hypothetical protein n=1 Tax=Leucobacter sp. gxy201 TaxID=2957200 RepID=UPI003DA0DB90
MNVSRAQALGEAWAELGPEVAVLANASGRPLARTVKLILDPLVIRPQQHPRLATGSLSTDAAAELRARIGDARSDLIATAAWYREVKAARRRVRVTVGNPQDLYFQRCFESARTHGDPAVLDPAVRAAIAEEIVHESAPTDDELTSGRLLAFARDPARSGSLVAELEEAWAVAARSRSRATAPQPAPERLRAALDGSSQDFDALVASDAGSARGAGLFAPGAAAEIGLTDREVLEMPCIGTNASKRGMPKPFDRSIAERLFAALPSLVGVSSADDLPRLCIDEVHRAAAAWQLADERSRVTMALGAEASSALLDGADDASGALTGTVPVPTRTHARLSARWRREAYVRRARRLPGSVAPGTVADVADIRGAYVRRLWVRLHGRELREQPVAAEELEGTFDGVLRSVVLDHRHRLKRAIERDLGGAA